MKHRKYLPAKRSIGFIANPPEIVMEEAADASEYGAVEGRAYAAVSPEAWDHLTRELMEERVAIIRGDSPSTSISN